MSHARQSTGLLGEQLAARHVQALGWPILDRNWRIRGGELDLVARDGEWLVVIEVRTRRGERFGRPEESIDARKQRRLLGLAQRYVHRKGWRGAWRIDVIAIDLPRQGRLGGASAPSPLVPTAPARRDPDPDPGPDPEPGPGSGSHPHERVLPDGTRLRHLRHAVAP